jgi:hypothetical protein
MSESNSQQKIVFVTGKGGVGKSTIALALAKKLSANQKVLLVELGLRSFYADFLGVPVYYQPSNYTKNLDLALWSGSECLKEYALHLLKIEGLYRLFFENRISRALIEVAPALSELSILGKITSGVRHVGPPLKYDVIVVDCYATGHMMAMLRAPRGMAEAIQFGPMAEQTSTMMATIRNPEISSYVIVSLPEELPAVEADELFREIRQEVAIEPHIICNRVWPKDELQKIKDSSPKPFSDLEMNFMREIEGLVMRQQAWVSYLKHRHPQVKELPMVFSSQPEELINSLVTALPCLT